MISESVKKKLAAHKYGKEDSFGRQIYFLYRYLVVWDDEWLPRMGLEHMGPGHIHLLFTIGPDGVTNSGMARRTKVSKQAMSKVVKEMLKQGLIVIKPNLQDSRCNIICLTDKGAEAMMKIWEANNLMRAEIENRLGKVKSKKLLSLMAELVESLEPGNTPKITEP